MKKLAVFVLAVIFALSIPVCAYASKNDENVKAESVVLMCLDTGDVLYEKNKDKKAYPASVTKVMSILLTVEALDSGKIKINDKVTASFALAMTTAFNNSSTVIFSPTSSQI